MNEDIKYQLENIGYCNIENISNAEELLKLANSLGKVLPHPNGALIDTLTPNDGKNASKGSFSYLFGYGAFPLHTDTAFWATPAKYMILYSELASTGNSLIYNSNNFISSLNTKESNLAKSAIFLVKTFNGQHYTSLIFKEGDTNGFRYDPCCMFPTNNAAREILNVYEKHLELNKPEQVNWIGSNAIILDNWKILHGRSKVDKKDKRIINRIYLETIL